MQKFLLSQTLLTVLLLAGIGGTTLADDKAAPCPDALQRAAVEQAKLAPEIPGSLILGNGDLNGILWLHQGQLRFTITKNDACDGRLDTTQDPELVRIDVPNHKWTAKPRSGNPPSWDKPYPCPLICGHVEFGRRPAENPVPAWKLVRGHAQAGIDYDEAGKQAVIKIKGHAGDSAGWGFAPRLTAPAKRVMISVSGGDNARWYLDLPGTGVKSGWQPAKPEVTEAVFEIPAGKTLEQIDLYAWTNDGQPAEIRLHSVSVDGQAQSLAGAKQAAVPALAARLDLARAVGILTGPDGMSLTARVLANRNAMVFETTQTVAQTPCTASFIPASKCGDQNGINWTLTTVPGDGDWPGMSFALAHAAQGTRHAVAVVTSLESKDPVAAAVKLASEALAEDAARQIAAHETVWNEFWSASGIALADPYLESVWYRNLYFLRCCSKPGAQPIGLFMGCASDVMPWHGCATTDYNFEQAFWGAFATNHAELAEPYNRYMVDYLPRGKWFAKETYGLEGAFYPVNHFTHQLNDPAACKTKNNHMNFYIPWTYVPGANGWQAQNVWLAYLHQPDRKYLQENAYPLVREMAIFYADFLEHCRKTPEGKAVYGPTYSPEHRGFGTDDTPCDIAWTRFTIKAAIQGATVLACDAELVKRWQAAQALVPDYPQTPKTNPPVIADVRGGEPIQYNVPVPVLPVFPAGEINWWSPEPEKAIFGRTIETIRTTGYNSVMVLAGARARLSLPGTHEWITREFRARQMPNGYLMLLGDTRGNYSEQMAAAGIVSELLLQSVGDTIRVFPTWPKDKDARFINLRAQGGFLVSADQKAGIVTKIEITATAGGRLRYLNPWTGKIVEVETKRDQKVTVTP